MLKTKKKKTEEVLEVKEEKVETVDETSTPAIEEVKALPEEEKAIEPVKEKKKGKKKKDAVAPNPFKDKSFDELMPPIVMPTDVATVDKKTSDNVEEDLFKGLAALFGVSVEEIKEECFNYQVKKFMSKMGKLIVRYNLGEADLETAMLNSFAISSGGVFVAPIYLKECALKSKKHRLDGVTVGSVIDFPFGESSFKSKVQAVREGMKIGVDEVLVTIPNVLFSEQNYKELKKQVKKVGGIFKEGSGIILNATDLDDVCIKKAVRLINKTKLSFITFAFGEATLEEVKNKMEVVNKYRGAKKVRVLANVDSAEAVSELLKLKADMVLTPYADEIGKTLVERFNIKSVKLR